MPGDRRVHRSFDAATRAAALDLATKLGDRAAAEEIGCSSATIRSWRKRAGASTAVTPARHDATANADALQAEATEAREAERRTLERVETMADSGDANAARALSAVARDHAARRQGLETAERHQREHDLRVAQAERQLDASRTRIYLAVVRLFIEWLGFGWGRPQADLAEAVLGAYTHGERLPNGSWKVQAPRRELAAAREAIDRQLVREYDKPAEDEAEGDKAGRRFGGIDLDALKAEVRAERPDDSVRESAAITRTEPDSASATPADFPVAVSPPAEPSEPAPEPNQAEPHFERFLAPITPHSSGRRERAPSFRHPDLDY